MDKEEFKDWPIQIRVSGLPFMLQGWNSVYTRADFFQEIVSVDVMGPPLYFPLSSSDNAPIYILEAYWLYRIIPITAVKIVRVNGEWQLCRMRDYEIFYSKPTNKKGVKGLLGPWLDSEMTVSCEELNC